MSDFQALDLVGCRIANSIQNAKFKIKNALDSGEALDRFRQNIELQGGNPKVCDKPELLLSKKLSKVPIIAGSSGYVAEIDTFAVGCAVSEIGGGRINAEDTVDPAVGYACVLKIGDRVRTGDTLGVIHCRRPDQGDSVSEKLKNAYRITKEISRTTKLIRAVV